MNNNTKEKQHTVPQFILRNFSINNKLYTYDKQIEKVYCSNVKNSGCERGFYDFKISTSAGLIEGTIEGKLCAIEGGASRVLEKIIKHDTVADLTDEEREQVAYFLGAQMIRTQNVKKNYKSMPEQLRNAIRNKIPNLANDTSLDEKLPDFDDNDLNLWFDMLIVDLAEGLKNTLKGLEWILVKTDESKPFLIGDSPVVVYNELYHDIKESNFFSKYSIGYKGACVFFPISPTRALWLVDYEFIDKYVQINQEALRTIFSIIRVAQDIERFGKDLQENIDREGRLTKTKILTFSSNDVYRYNYLEIINAERKVFSRFSDFKQVEALIKKNSFYKHGMRIRAD